MIGLEDLIGQKRPVQLLANALQNDKMPHAWLFTGEDGVGKKTAALALAMISNCQNPDLTGLSAPQTDGQSSVCPRACGNCRSCKKIAAGVHPEVRMLEPSGPNIRIDRIRSLCSDLALKSDERSCRFVIIDPASRMNAEAANALLKILEEPPEHTVFVLIAADTGDLLPTIVSRCQHIRFHPIAPAELETYLRDECGIAPQQAMIVASLARGSLGRAVEMAAQDWSARRNFFIGQLRKLPAQPRGIRHVLAEIMAKDKDRIEANLEIMKNWYRDLAVGSAAPELLYNRDLSDQVYKTGSRISMDQILEKTDAIAAAEKALTTNANARLVMDALVEALAAQGAKTY
ncbi:MAG: DNA polymerase III subunit delta' [Desulfosalsimonas sp.]|uniref:DNA polymerase III subunit delta' n=1 Tax=Desulfosalsimonas sp. TaxID=3073848 RepID=UPI003970DA6D